jgi:hypothetical protein
LSPSTLNNGCRPACLPACLPVRIDELTFDCLPSTTNKFAYVASEPILMRGIDAVNLVGGRGVDPHVLTGHLFARNVLAASATRVNRFDTRQRYSFAHQVLLLISAKINNGQSIRAEVTGCVKYLSSRLMRFQLTAESARRWCAMYVCVCHVSHVTPDALF